jgi:hypothetical protein
MEQEVLKSISRHARDPFVRPCATSIPHLALRVSSDSLEEYRGNWYDPPYDGVKGRLLQTYLRATCAAKVSRFDRPGGKMMNPDAPTELLSADISERDDVADTRPDTSGSLQTLMRRFHTPSPFPARDH